MIPSSNNKINSIAILRVIAMTMVVFYHCICCYGIWQGTFVFSGVYIDIWMRIAVYLNYLHVPTFFYNSGKFLFVPYTKGFGRITHFLGNDLATVLYTAFFLDLLFK